MEHAGASVSRFRLVGALHEEGRSDELPGRDRPSRLASAQSRQPDEQAAGLRVDRPHVSPARVRRQLGLLRPAGRTARLRERPDGLPGRSAELMDGGHLEPVAVVRHRAGRTASSSNVQRLGHFFQALQSDSLPAVSWVIPGDKDSEHPPSTVTDGQTYVTGLINSIMRSSAWSSRRSSSPGTTGAGSTTTSCRRPSTARATASACRGSSSARTRSRGTSTTRPQLDAYLKFIEDDFLDGQRLDPSTDGRPDPRPDVRESEPILGNLVNDFDFDQKPLPPLILPVHPFFS